MTIDAEGMLWVAMYDGWKVSQVHLVCKVQIVQNYAMFSVACYENDKGPIFQTEIFDCTVEPCLIVTLLIIQLPVVIITTFFLSSASKMPICFLVN